MKIIGRTEAGAKLVEMEMEEVIALLNAAQALKRFSLCCPLENNAPPAIPPAVEPIPGARTARKKVGRRPQAAPSEIIGNKRICLICEKPLPKNADPRSKYHPGKCEKIWKAKYAREFYRAKHPGSARRFAGASGVKNPRLAVDRGPLIVDRLTNPADPRLTDEQRRKLKANREEMLKTIDQRIAARGN